jgi:hypothetical protein
MKAQIKVDVIPISVAPIQSLLQQNNIGVTYVGTSNFRMELVKSMPLYFMAMPQFIITIIKAPFVSTLVIIASNIISKPHTLKGT